MTRPAFCAAVALSLFLALPAEADPPVDYDIVYVRQPRYGDETNTTWPEVFHPGRIEPGADLMLLHPDGSEEVLVAGGPGAVTDPVLSFDGEWVYYSYFPDVSPTALNYQRGSLSYAGAKHLSDPSRDPRGAAAHLFRVHAQYRRRPLGRVQPGRPSGRLQPARLRNP